MKADVIGNWWKEGVIYQIYPQSFMDSNDDGVGDLQGIIQKLDYLNDGTNNSLGIDAIWLSPIYPSPMKDFGYDIKDYKAIDPLFGTMDDFLLLLEEAHKRNIKIIMDLVINHSSDEHPWFIESRSSVDNPKRDWYIWKDGPKRPNNWISYFEMHSAWWSDSTTNSYYLGTFTRHQPEFNWRNPEVRKALLDVITFWLDLGVDGFRMDVVNWYIKDDKWRNNPWHLSLSPPAVQKHIYDRNQEETHAICREIRQIADRYKDKVLIGEIFTKDVEEAVSYHGNQDELHMAFNFNFLFQKWSPKAFYKSITKWYQALDPKDWPNVTLSNHDQPRHYYRYRKGSESLPRAKVAAAMLLTLRGTPFLYYGEEIGMKNHPIRKDHLQDPLGKKGWPLIKGRDGERTPMQWDGQDYSGFSTHSPWLPVNKDYHRKNVAIQEQDNRSLLHYYRSLIWLRKKTPSIRKGQISFLITKPRELLIYKRIYQQETCIILLNFTSDNIPLPLIIEGDYTILHGTHLRENSPFKWKNRIIRPYEVIIAIKNDTYKNTPLYAD